MGIWSWLRRAKPRPRRPARPRPSDWRKTIDDLMAEKRTIPAEELEWARGYEREQLRAWARFPKDGEEFEASGDVTVDYLVHWQAPFTGGGEGTIPEGTRIRVSVGAEDAEPVGVHATPLDGGRLEKLLVPEADRGSRKYGGFSLFIPVAQLNRDFRLVGR